MKQNRFLSLVCWIAGAACIVGGAVAAQPTPVDCHEVVWTTPSTNSAGSMPLGNGDISVNAWAERGGDLLLYIGKGDSWDENGRLLKLGRLRLHFSQQPFAVGKPFRQVLHTDRGEIEIETGEPGGKLQVRLWVDANRPVVRIETESEQAFELEARLEVWRTAERELQEIEDHLPVGKLSKDERTRVTPDTILDIPEALGWLHRNERSVWAGTLRHQDLAALIPKFRDPLLDLTSGALVRGENLRVADRMTLRSQAPGKRFTVSVHPLVAQTGSGGQWLGLARKQAATSDEITLDKAREQHRDWWTSFWQRSYLEVSGSREAETVSSGYNIQRFLLACASRGRQPNKFNGSIFTMDGTRKTPGERCPEKYDADYRAWGAGYWFQNTRLLYWPMLMTGDFDMMQPFFNMYRDALPLASERTRLYFDHAGAFFPETITFWGTYLNYNYGLDRSGKTTDGSDLIAAMRGETQRGPWKPGEVANTFIRHHLNGNLELLTIMLDYHAITQDAQFRDGILLPMARAILTFFREHYPRRDTEGKIVLAPSQSLETWQQAVNPTPDVAGLHWVTHGLLALDGLADADRKAWTELRDLLPPVPTRAEYWTKKKYLIPAQQYDMKGNGENTETYAVFPFRLFGVGKPELETGRETYARRLAKGTGGWAYDSIQSALLGLTDEAKRDVLANFSSTNPNLRFAAFFGDNGDWNPSPETGGVAMIALQRMLLQWDGRRLLLLPAWPKDWDVRFKLHAPQQTTVECEYRAGKVQSLKVTPEARRKDVEVMIPVND
ncbi:MAG: DUF5703 domain-containing protein [Verrucomicrobiota bacterium]